MDNITQERYAQLYERDQENYVYQSDGTYTYDPLLRLYNDDVLGRDLEILQDSEPSEIRLSQVNIDEVFTNTRLWGQGVRVYYLSDDEDTNYTYVSGREGEEDVTGDLLMAATGEV